MPTLLPTRAQVMPSAKGFFTNIVSREDLAARADEIRFGPCVLQEYIPKQHELRVTVFGKQIFASELDTQSEDVSRIDSRRGNLHSLPEQRIVTLDDRLTGQIHALLDRLGLVLGCIDIVVSPSGRQVFLEINPNGQWYWVEYRNGSSAG